MDAVKFLKEKKRMCESFKSCGKCPFYYRCGDLMGGYVEEAVRIVEQWSNDHPVMTNLMKFEEVFGKCDPEVSASISWWSKEYKEPNGDEEE